MNNSAHPQFFERFPMRAVDSSGLDAVLVDDDAIRILFLWGPDCSNCDVAKADMLLAQPRLRWPDVHWLQADVYDDRPMATRFGLHGIPTFIVFRGSRKLGRISPWPGSENFIAAIEQLHGRRPG